MSQPTTYNGGTENDCHRQALSQTIECERENLYRYLCYRLGDVEVAADVFQDACLSVYQAAKRGHIDDFRGYLWRSASNVCTSYMRHRQQMPTISLEEASIPDEEPGDDFEHEFQKIETLMAQLPAEQAEVIRLRTAASKGFAEIAQILDIPLPTAKSRFRYGIEHLRRLIVTDNKQA